MKATGQIIEVEQSIKEPAHEVLEVDGELVSVRRLISGTAMIDLRSGPSGGWGSTGYSKSARDRWAEAQLGRPLVKPNGGK